MVFKKRGKSQYKYCPVCGTKLETKDTYCTSCGYSFEARHKKHRKGIKWRNIILLIIILIIIYLGYQYLTGQSLIPESLSGLLNSTK